MVDDGTPAGEWENWNGMVGSDLADPAFQGLVAIAPRTWPPDAAS